MASATLPKQSIACVAESIGIPNLSEDAATALAPDVEYRLREIIQDAEKFMRHGKRDYVTIEDINNAIKLRGVEPLYGYKESEGFKFKKVPHSKEHLYYIQDDDINLIDIVNAPLPRCPIDVTYSAHWLAIEGVQPAIPENPPVIITSDKGGKKGGTNVNTSGATTDTRVLSSFAATLNLPVDVRPQVRHVISKELQLYFETMTEAITGTDDRIRKIAIESVGTDPGLQQLIPYFCQFIAYQVTNNSRNLPRLTAIVQLIKSLLDNSYLFMEPYIHHLMSNLLTCALKKTISQTPQENHWSLREMSASLISQIVSKWGPSYNTLQSRTCKTCVRGLLDPSKPLTTNYGAIACLHAMGPTVIRSLLIPSVKLYSDHISQFLGIANPNIVHREQAYRVKGLLQNSLGEYFRWYANEQRLDAKQRNQNFDESIQIQKENEADISESVLEAYEKTFGLFGESLLPYAKINIKLYDLIQDLSLSFDNLKSANARIAKAQGRPSKKPKKSTSDATAEKDEGEKGSGMDVESVEKKY